VFASLKKIYNKPNFYKLFLGLFIAQIINFIGFMLLPKLYAPQDFALFGTFTAFVFIIIEILNLKLDIALQIADNKNEHIFLLQLSILIGILLSIFLFLFLLVFFPKNYFALLPIVLLAYAINQPMLAYLNVQKNNNSINISRIIVVSITLIASVLATYFLNKKYGLIFGFLIGQMSASLYFVIFNYNTLSTKFEIEKLKNTFKKYIQFPTIGLVSSLVNTISKNSIVILIELLFGTIYCGYYTMSSRLLLAPASLYQTAMTQVFIQDAKDLSDIEMRKLVLQTFWFGLLLGVIPSLVLLFFAQNLFFYLFGETWEMAGKLTQYLILWYLASTIISPIAMVLDIKKYLEKELLWNSLLLFFRISLLFIGYYFFDFWAAMLLVMLVGVVMNFALLFYILRILR
jgi:O-antigen/teichoic acid export membrane protein